MEIKKFPDYFPEGCPPEEATEKEMTLFRLCKHNYPCEEDFQPHVILYPDREEYKANVLAYGLSTLPSVEDCEHLLKISSKMRSCMKCIAFGKVDGDTGKVLNTPNKNNSNHMTWWVYEGVKPHTFFTAYQEGGAKYE